MSCKALQIEELKEHIHTKQRGPHWVPADSWDPSDLYSFETWLSPLVVKSLRLSKRVLLNFQKSWETLLDRAPRLRAEKEAEVGL